MPENGNHRKGNELVRIGRQTIFESFNESTIGYYQVIGGNNGKNTR